MGFLGHLISKAVIQVTRHQQKYWVGFIYCYFCLFIRFANHLIAKKQQQKFFHYKLSLFWRIRIVNCRPISFSFFSTSRAYGHISSQHNPNYFAAHLMPEKPTNFSESLKIQRFRTTVHFISTTFQMAIQLRESPQCSFFDQL